MSLRILTVLVCLWASRLYPAATSRWIYYPQYSRQSGVVTSGLHIYFEAPLSLTATVSVKATRDGVAVSQFREISTNCSDGCWFKMGIADLNTFRVTEIRIQMGPYESRIANPETGHYYDF